MVTPDTSVGGSHAVGALPPALAYTESRSAYWEAIMGIPNAAPPPPLLWSTTAQGQRKRGDPPRVEVRQPQAGFTQTGPE